MRKLRLPILLLALMAVGTTARAQTTQRVLTYTGHSGVVSTQPFGGAYYYVGPYHGSAPGMGSFDMYCVDFLHHVADSRPDLPGTNWNANFTKISNLGSGGLQYTRLGNAGLTNSDAVIRYQRSAFLATKFWEYQTSPNKAQQWTAIHSAIWRTADAGLGSVPNWIGSQAFVDAATSFDPNSMNWDYWQVVTPTNLTSASSSQEFLVYSTPEPGTILLMGSGLLALVGAAVVTRRAV
ncbi:MAG: PEP-CTERM sorting domain-containing protein [Gemmatimonadales bacterium]|nr:PEP-CTERM sorting domain-containing protein [Gemmatimonadales bacterium]